jgi:flagellar basal body-associated protein FliL
MRHRGRRAGKAILVLILGAALLVAGGAWAFMHFRGAAAGAEGDGQGEQEAQQETLGPEETLDLGEFLVNVLDKSNALRYLKAKVSVVVQGIESDEAQPEAEAGHGGGAKGEGPQLPPDEHRLARDAVVQVLSSQRFEELRDDQDKQRLRKLLLQRLDQALDTYRVNQVLITDFVMQ